MSLLGPSGCGKTTTLRLIAGSSPPSEGEIRVDDRVISAPGAVLPPEQRQMAMIFQSYAVWPHKTVAENVGYGLEFKGIREPRRARARGADAPGSPAGRARDRYPGELSGGQQQRVALARALVVEPNVLLLDEPLSNLDANLREEMRYEIRRLHEEFEITTVYVTHDQAEAMVTSDRIAVMNAGRIEQMGTAEEVYDRPATAFVAAFIGASNILDCEVQGNRATVGGLVLQLAITDPGGGSAPRAIHSPTRHRGPRAPGERPAERVEVNVLPGVVRRHIYLGDSRDYLVALDDSDVALRVIVPPRMRHAVGDRVALHIPSDACHLLAES